KSFGRVYFWPDTHATPLVAGCLLAFVRDYRLARWLAAPALALYGYAVIVVYTGVGVGPYLEFTPVVTICSAFIVLAAVTDGWFARALAWRPLVWLGLISYSLYLWHIPLMFHLFPHEKLLGLALSIAVATASYRLIEQPFRRRRDSVGQSRLVPAPAT